MKKPDYSRADYYSKKAKAHGFPARSVFKLQELDNRFKIFSKAMRVLDLGASPGSWIKYASEKVGDSGFVLGIDRNPLKLPLNFNENFIQADIFNLNPLDLKTKFGSFDLILSDLSPDLMGQKSTDALRAISLAERAFKFAEILLKPGGNFLVKVFEGPGYEDFYKFLKGSFASVNSSKPKSSRPNSREMYIYCKGFLVGKIKE